MLRFTFFPICLLPARLWAAGSEPVNFFFSGLKLFIATLIVVGIMLLIHVLQRRGVKFLKGKSPTGIKILETRPVGGRKSLCLVEVRGQELLVGIGNERIDFLYHFGAPKGSRRFEDDLQKGVKAKP
ncbi:MAG: FliO/MopB family protein [Thermodesulfobacteriota bacterium]